MRRSINSRGTPSERRRAPSLFRLASLISLVLIGFLSACAPPEPLKPRDPEAEAAAQRNWEINLPPRLDLDSLVPPLRDAQGEFRIDGVLRRAEDFYGQTLNLSGFVTGKSPPCPRRRGTYRCVAPYFWLSQDPPPAEREAEVTESNELVNEYRRVKVVGIERPALRRLRVGQRYQVNGLLTTEAEGFIRSTGLLVFKSSQRLR